MREDHDPDRIRSIAVHRSDVATALEATIRTDRLVVLRITPPFAGRMRARIHEITDGAFERTDDGPNDDERGPEPIHVDPRDLVADVPSYPEVDDTTAAFPDVDVETRHERHADAVDAWRETVRDCIVDRVSLEVDGVAHDVEVKTLG